MAADVPCPVWIYDNQPLHAPSDMNAQVVGSSPPEPTTIISRSLLPNVNDAFFQ